MNENWNSKLEIEIDSCCDSAHDATRIINQLAFMQLLSHCYRLIIVIELSNISVYTFHFALRQSDFSSNASPLGVLVSRERRGRVSQKIF